MGQPVFPKLWCLPTSLHGITTQKNSTDILIVVFGFWHYVVTTQKTKFDIVMTQKTTVNVTIFRSLNLRASKEWHHPSSLNLKNLWVPSSSSEKVMWTVFWDMDRTVVTNYLQEMFMISSMIINSWSIVVALLIYLLDLVPAFFMYNNGSKLYSYIFFYFEFVFVLFYFYSWGIILRNKSP
jgi:hypothetical protein